MVAREKQTSGQSPVRPRIPAFFLVADSIEPVVSIARGLVQEAPQHS
jgi:hypothetical protein